MKIEVTKVYLCKKKRHQSKITFVMSWKFASGFTITIHLE